jgi:DNA repair photolyase
MKPFSDELFHKDSTMFYSESVEHLTSWLTINPYKGCSLACAYCFRANWHKSEKPELIMPVEMAIEQLIQHPEFVPGDTPISINNSSTDPLLPKVRQSTFKAIELLEVKELSNPFVIISKLKLKKVEVEFLRSLKFVKPIFFGSLSLIPKHIEPAPVSIRIQNMRALSKAGIPVVMYFRPIVEGWNDSPEIIEQALLIGQKYCNAICIGSLRMSPSIREELEKVGIQNLDFPDDFHTKKMEEAIESRILTIYAKNRLTVPLFKHSSCAVSYLMNWRNYNYLFKNPKKNCLSTCPSEQQDRCNSEEI